MDLEDIATKTFTSSSPIQNYKELYEQAKKNVSLFINQVDNELSKIMMNHEKELNDLKRENQALKKQLKEQSQLVVASHNNSSIKQKKNTSTTKSFSQERIKDFIDCGISQISLAQSKTIFTDKKKSSIISYILRDKDENVAKNPKGKQSKVYERNSSISHFDKQNQWEETSDLVELKQRLAVCKRAKKNNVCFLNDQQSIKDVLKNIREKVNTPIDFEKVMKKQFQEKPKDIIVPEMFTYQKR